MTTEKNTTPAPRLPVEGRTLHQCNGNSANSLGSDRASTKDHFNRHHLILALGAHPDDAALGAGGLAAHAVARGNRVIFLTATAGELGGDPAVRKAEDLESAQVLGVEVIGGGLRDGRVGLRSAIALIQDAIRRFGPSTVLVHHPHDSHQDHRTLSRAAVAAARQVENLLFYEGPTSQRFWPSLTVDISSVWNQKQEALLAHESQMARGNFLEWADTSSRFRAWPRHKGAHCEGFRVHHGDLSTISNCISSHQSAKELTFANYQVGGRATLASQRKTK